MATDIVQSLFGVTPEMYQQQQDALVDKQALQFAQLDPMQQANYGIFRGASQLGGVLGRALGGQDPELAKVSLRQSIARQLNFNDPKSIQAGVLSLSQAGDTQGAMMLADTARKAASEMALAQQRAAEKMTPEQRNALAYAASKGEPGTDAYKAAFLEKFEELTSKNIDKKTPEQRNAEAFAATKGEPGSAEYNAAFQSKFEELIAKKPTANVKEVGVAEGTRKPVYLDVNNNEQFVFGTDAQGKQIRQPYVGGVDRTTAKVSATSQNIQENEFSKQLGKAQADRYKSAVEARDTAIATIANYTELGKLNDQALISGAFASGRVGVSNLFNTLGLLSAADSAKLASSEQYQKLAGDALLAALGGKLGGQISDSDRKFVERIVPQLENSPAARRELIAYMQEKNRKVAEEATRLIDYAETKRTLTGFVPAMPLFNAGGGALSGLTDEELKRRYEAAKGKK